MDLDVVVAELNRTRNEISEVKVPKGSGIYATFLKNGTILPVGDNDCSGLIYIGKSDQLAQREYETDFKSMKTGFSTLRRSLGALLKEPLQLTANPRGKGKVESNFTNYRFDEEGENRLSEWMLASLEVGVCPVSIELVNQTKTDLIAMLEPVLCLKGWKNPQASVIRLLRGQCAQEAEDNFSV